MVLFGRDEVKSNAGLWAGLRVEQPQLARLAQIRERRIDIAAFGRQVATRESKMQRRLHHSVALGKKTIPH